MGRRAQARRLALWMNGERVGTWVARSAGDELHYDAQWIGSPRGRPLSLSLPFLPGQRPHKGAAVRAWFENLLPDSAPIRERLARRFRAATTQAFDLLEQIGRDCVGALQLVPDGVDPGDIRKIDAEPLDEAGVARLLRAAVALPAPGEEAGAADLRISIAGAQEKTALLWHDGRWWRPRGATPTTHILKLPMGVVGPQRLDLRDSVDNEWLCAQLLDAFGVPVARCHPLAFEDRRVLGVERFDRRRTDDGRWLLRLPQEDLCQATGTPPHLRYESDGGPGIARVLDVLAGSSRRDTDRATFFRSQVLFWLLCAPDGHAKNFSIALRPGGAYVLTPLYDVLSAYPLLGRGANQLSPHRVRLAMAVRANHAHWRVAEVRRRHWVQLGHAHGIVTADGGDAEAIIDDLVARAPTVVDRVRTMLPDHFPAALADRVFAGVLTAARRLAAP